MVVGVLQMDLRVPGATSLKDKRRGLESLLTRLHTRFRVAAAEVDDHERHRHARIAVACVSTAAAHAHQVLSRVVDAVERDRNLVLDDYTIEVR